MNIYINGKLYLIRDMCDYKVMIEEQLGYEARKLLEELTTPEDEEEW